MEVISTNRHKLGTEISENIDKFGPDSSSPCELHRNGSNYVAKAVHDVKRRGRIQYEGLAMNLPGMKITIPDLKLAQRQTGGFEEYSRPRERHQLQRRKFSAAVPNHHGRTPFSHQMGLAASNRN